MNELQKRRSMHAFILSNVMAGLEGTVVATALPAIVATFHSLTLMSWVVTAYALMMAVAAPIWTKLAERFGYKEIFMVGTWVFVAGSALSGLAVSMPMLIFMHGLMGIGSGAIMQLPYVIYGLMFEPARRRTVVGNAIAAFSAASILGPIVGGLIVDAMGWRWVFFVNVPIGLLMIGQVARYFRLDGPRNHKAIDSLGALLLSLATIALMLSFQFLGGSSLNLPLILGLLAGSLGLYGCFILAERRATDPIVPLALFGNPSLMAKNGIMFIYFGFFAFYTNYLPTWGQGVLGTTALVGGLLLVPGALTNTIGTQLANRLIAHGSERRVVALGLLVMLVGDGLLVALPSDASFVLLLTVGGLFGLAIGLVNGTLQVGIQETVPAAQMGAATALNALIRTLGTTLILSGLAVALNQTFAAATRRDPRLSLSLLNKISDSTALRDIPTALVAPLRGVLYTGLHGLALISFVILLVALGLNFIDPWRKA